MRYLVAVVAVVIVTGCDDPVEPRQQGPYQVTRLRTLEGMEATFGDLNENGQALWNEGEQAILWDNGSIVEVPVERFLGPSGEVLGWSSVWIQGQLTELPGRTKGILEDGTIYLSRNDTMFTWRDGMLTVTDRPVGHLVGPEGRIWENRSNPDDDPQVPYDEMICGFYQDGQWDTVVLAGICNVLLVEESGWAIIHDAGATNPGRYVFGPNGYQVPLRGSESVPAPGPLVHLNDQGHSVTSDGFVAEGSAEITDLWEHFDSIRPGAINDDGEILAQLDNEVVLLTPR